MAAKRIMVVDETRGGTIAVGALALMMGDQERWSPETMSAIFSLVGLTQGQSEKLLSFAKERMGKQRISGTIVKDDAPVLRLALRVLRFLSDKRGETRENPGEFLGYVEKFLEFWSPEVGTMYIELMYVFLLSDKVMTAAEALSVNVYKHLTGSGGSKALQYLVDEECFGYTQDAGDKFTAALNRNDFSKIETRIFAIKLIRALLAKVGEEFLISKLREIGIQEPGIKAYIMFLEQLK